MVHDAACAIIKDDGNTNRFQLLFGFFGIIVDGKSWKHECIPEERLDFHSFAHGIAQHGLHREVMATPEVDISLLESFGTQVGEQSFLFGATVWPGAVIGSPHKLHAGSDPPVCQVDVLAGLKKMDAHGIHCCASIDEIGDTRVRAYRCISLGPPVAQLSGIGDLHKSYLLSRVYT